VSKTQTYIRHKHESFHSHLSKSFSGPHPNIISFFERSFAVPNEYVHSAAEHSVSKSSEETGRDTEGIHKENLGFIYNTPNQS